MSVLSRREIRRRHDPRALGTDHRSTLQINFPRQQPLSVQPVLSFINSLNNIEIIHQAGIRCIHDYMRDLSHQTTHYEALLDAEITYSTQSPYMWLGKYFHLVLRKV